MTRYEKLISVSTAELIQEFGSIDAAIVEAEKILRDESYPREAHRFYTRVIARLQWLAVRPDLNAHGEPGKPGEPINVE